MAISLRGTAQYATTGAADNVNSVSLTKPAGVVSGDLLLIFAMQRSPNATFAIPTGFTAIPNVTDATANIVQQLFYRVATGTEASTFTVTSSVANQRIAAVCLAYAFVDTSQIFDPSNPTNSGQINAASLNVDAGTGPVTVTDLDRLVWFGGSTGAANTAPANITVPSGYTAIGTQHNTSDVSSNNAGLIVGHKTQGTHGATGDVAGTQDGSRFSGALIIALPPAPDGLPVPAGGNWNSASTWRSGSVPTSSTDVVLDSAFTGTLTVVGSCVCKSLKSDGSGIGNGHNSSGTLTFGALGTLTIGTGTTGTVLLTPSLNLVRNAGTQLVLSGSMSVTSGGNVFPDTQLAAGTITLQDNLSLGTGSDMSQGMIELQAGTLNTHGNIIDCIALLISGAGAKTLTSTAGDLIRIWGNSTVALTGTAGRVVNYTGTNLTATSAPAIAMNGNGAEFYGGASITWAEVDFTCTTASSSQKLTSGASVVYSQLSVLSAASGYTFTVNTCTATSLTTTTNASCPMTFKVVHGNTITTTNLTLTGLSGSIITVASDSAGSAGTLSCGGAFSSDYVTVSDNTASGAASPFRATHFTKGTNTTNWIGLVLETYGVDAYIVYRTVNNIGDPLGPFRLKLSRLKNFNYLRSPAVLELWGVDAVVSHRLTLVPLVDAVLLRHQTSIPLVDALLKQIGVKASFNVDAVLKKNQTSVYNVDALLKKNRTITSNVDVLIKRIVLINSQVDAFLKRPTPISSNVDAVLKQHQTQTWQVNAVLKKSASLTWSVDGLLRNVHTLNSFTDTVLLKKQTRTWQADAIVLKLGTLINHSVDAMTKKTNPKTHNTDAMVKRITPLTHSVDAVLKGKGQIWAADAMLKVIHTINHGVDADLKQTKTLSSQVDASIFRARAFNVDSIIMIPRSKNYNVDAVLAFFNGSAYAVDSLISRSELEYSLVDALIVKQYEARWWNNRYPYRRQLQIVGPINQNHPIIVPTDLQKLFNLGKMRADHNDIVLLHLDGIEWTVLGKATVNGQIQFPAFKDLGAGEIDSNYYMYYGNPNLINQPSLPSYTANLWPDRVTIDDFHISFTRPGDHWIGGVSSNSSAVATFSFNGPQIRIVADTNHHQGILEVQVDDGAWIPVDLYSLSPQTNIFVYVNMSLSDGNHTIRVKPSGNKNRVSKGTSVNIKGFDYNSMVFAVDLIEQAETLNWGGSLGGS